MRQPIIHGGVYKVADRAIRLLPDEKRDWHNTRRSFLVLSGPDTNSDPEWPIVMGCPLSSSGAWRSRFDVKLPMGEGGVNKKVWVRIPQLQPLLKDDLEDRTGTLSQDRLEEVLSRLIDYMGYGDEDEKPTNDEFPN